MSAKNINDPDFENESSEVAESSYDETYEDDVTYTEDDSEEWSDDSDLSDDAGDEDEQPAPKKKTSNLTIAIILVVAVIGVFGFMILKGNKASAPQPTQEGQVAIDADADSSSTTTSADTATAQSNINDLKNQEDQNADGDAEQTINIKAPTPPSGQPQQGLMDNPNLLTPNEGNTAPAAEPGPTLSADQPPTLTAPDANPAVQPSAPPSQEVVKAISPTVKPVSDFPTVDSIKKPDTGTADQGAAPTLTATDSAVGLPVPPQTAAQATAQDDKAEKLQVQVNDAKEKIALLEKQLSDKSAELDAQKQIAAKAAATPAAVSGASDAEVEALKDKIADLEEKLAAKAEKPAKATATIPERKVIEDDSYSIDEPIVKKTVAPVKSQTVVKQYVWSLKSAGSGKAILSDKNTGDLKTVHVGDVVSGLGRIVSISSSNSGWVVKGTTGSVVE